MHICFLTPEYPHPLSKSSGGLGTSIKNLAESLIENGEKVTIVVYGQVENSSISENGIQFHFLKQLHYKVGGWWLYRKYIQTFLNKIIETNQVDLVEAPDWTGITAFMKLNCPLLIRLNGSDGYFCALEGRQQKWKNRLFERIALQSANVLISVSAFTAIKTKEVFNLKRDFTVIPNSIKTDNFVSQDQDKKLNQVLYFGTIIRKKGVLELAIIFNEVHSQRPETELLLLGKDVVDVFENRSTKELFKKRLTNTALKNVFFENEVPYSEVQSIIANSAVVVLPSFAEALPMTWLEAMAMEKAIVTSDVGWAPEVMEHGETGFTVNPKYHLEYAKKIIQLLEDENLAKQMGENARKKVLKEFSAPIIAKRNIDFYRKQME